MDEAKPWLFRPGNPGGGRPKDLLRRDDVRKIVGVLSKLEIEQVEKIATDKKTLMLEATVAAIYLRAAKDADPARLNFLLDRAIGKVREEIHIEHDEPDRKAARKFAKEILRDPETFGAASLLATKVANQQLLMDNERRDAERAGRADAAAGA